MIQFSRIAHRAISRAALPPFNAFNTPYVQYRSGATANVNEAATTPLRSTALHKTHVGHGGKMINFEGWSLPMYYGSEGIMSSHLHARSHAALFDVSHMGQLRLTGADRIKFIEWLVPGDIKSLLPGEMRLTVLSAENGCIIDDTIITSHEGFLSMIINAGCREKDIAHLQQHLQLAKSNGMDVDMEVIDSHSLIALQGPDSMVVLQSLLTDDIDLHQMPFMTSKLTTVDGVTDCSVSRCGYTGEDGFELSVPNEAVANIVETLLKNPLVKLAGLGARDTLRLESGFCLYGHDISLETSVVEAGLAWTVGKRRRVEGNFLGSDVILCELKEGVSRKRVGISMSDKSPAKEGAHIYDSAGEKVGHVTSSVFSPSLQRPIAMGYVKHSFTKVGSPLVVDVRGKMRQAEVVKLPFVATSFYRIP